MVERGLYLNVYFWNNFQPCGGWYKYLWWYVSTKSKKVKCGLSTQVSPTEVRHTQRLSLFKLLWWKARGWKAHKQQKLTPHTLETGCIRLGTGAWWEAALPFQGAIVTVTSREKGAKAPCGGWMERKKGLTLEDDSFVRAITSLVEKPSWLNPFEGLTFKDHISQYLSYLNHSLAPLKYARWQAGWMILWGPQKLS